MNNIQEQLEKLDRLHKTFECYVILYITKTNTENQTIRVANLSQSRKDMVLSK